MGYHPVASHLRLKLVHVWKHGNSANMCYVCELFVSCVFELLCVYSRCVSARIHAACVCCVCVRHGCVWRCQAIWSAVWGAHYPLSSAVGSGALSICPSSLSLLCLLPFHPLSLSFSLSPLCFIFCTLIFVISLFFLHLVSPSHFISLYSLYLILNAV